MEGYFGLAEQFTTQAEPAYCGLSRINNIYIKINFMSYWILIFDY